MIEPGYYKTNYRALRLREIVRWYGLNRGLRNYFKTRFMSAGSGAWMPGLWATGECKREDFSDEFWNATKPHRKDFEKLGFAECRFSKIASFNPSLRDRGSISYLDSTRRYFGQLIFRRIYSPSLGKERNEITIAFTAVLKDRSFTCTNARVTYDPLAETEVLRLNSYDVNFLYQEFLKKLPHYDESPRTFPNTDSLRRWFDGRQQKAFEERVKRGLFVLMTDREVAAARAKLEKDVPASPGTPGRLNLRWTIWLIIVGCIAALEFARNQGHRGRPDTVEYRGLEFKTRKAYDTYEDYKDDPQNLDTNELDRIEQTITTAKIPETFRNYQEFGKFLIFDLKFPGYGAGGIGENAKADDGTRLLVETVEIPQKQKDRVLTLRQSGDELKLVDDFVYSTATNQIMHVNLKDRVVHYYDGENRLIREKQL